MHRLCLVALMGLPGAGKTTLCQNLMQMESLPFNILHVCYDDLIHLNSETPQYKEQRENLLKSLKGIIQELEKSKNIPTTLQAMNICFKNSQSNDVVMLCDDNNYYHSMRFKLFQLAREHRIGYCQIFFKCSINLALKRNNLRKGSTKVPNDVIVRMYNRLEVPNTTDNKWEQNSFFLENLYFDNICKEIISYILQFLDKPLHPLQISFPKSTTTQSKVHELDLLLRKRIQIIMNSKQQDKKLLAKNLNDKKKEILKSVQRNANDELLEVLDLEKYVDMLVSS